MPDAAGLSLCCMIPRAADAFTTAARMSRWLPGLFFLPAPITFRHFLTVAPLTPHQCPTAASTRTARASSSSTNSPLPNARVPAW
jgi:hypothetical protein